MSKLYNMTVRSLWVVLIVAVLHVPAWANSMQVGLPAPEFDLVDVQGAKVSSKNLKGKVTLINFWATWCFFCRKEVPVLNKLYSTYKDKGLEVVGISLDQRGVLDVAPFMRMLPMSYKVLIGHESMSSKLGIFGLPATVIVDKNWKIVASYPGYVEYAVFEEGLRAALNQK